uniref:Putative secreted protein n=1 Tax=Anopheles triannulatus TaxID=58253 RepID=A0A2M4B7J3_9DIPT
MRLLAHLPLLVPQLAGLTAIVRKPPAVVVAAASAVVSSACEPVVPVRYTPRRTDSVSLRCCNVRRFRPHCAAR